MSHKLARRSFENSHHKENINLEDRLLFEHVLELEQMEKLINKVGPAEPAKFGKMEAFDDGHSDEIPHFALIISLVVLIIIIGFVLMGSGGCGAISSGSSFEMDSLSPQFGQVSRAVFVR